MSHYHMTGAMVSAYHFDETNCGPGEHTRYDTGERHYWSEVWKLTARASLLVGATENVVTPTDDEADAMASWLEAIDWTGAA